MKFLSHSELRKKIMSSFIVPIKLCNWVSKDQRLFRRLKEVQKIRTKCDLKYVSFRLLSLDLKQSRLK